MADGDKKPDDAPSTDGIFRGKDLAKLVALTADVQNLGGNQLNDVELEKMLADRIAGGKRDNNLVGDDRWDRARDLAEVIVDALPQKLHTDTVGAALDVRPYLEAIDGKKVIFRSPAGVLLPDVTKHKTVHTAGFLKQMNIAVHGDAVVADGGRSENVDSKYEPGKAGIVSAVDPTTGDFIAGAADATGPVAFPTDDLRSMVQSDQWTLEQLANEDLSVQQGTATTPGIDGFFPIETGMPGHGPRGGAAHKDVLGITPAINFLQTLTPTEVHDMQDKLASAGYFDKAGKGGNFTPGDAFDPNTMAAWKLLLTDSVKENRPVPEILGKNIKTYREEVRKERMGALAKTDPGYMRAIANDLGQTMIGRDLTPDEVQSLTNHVHGLQLRRAGYVAGANNTADEALPNDHGFTQDDLSAMMQNDPKLKGEQRMNNQNSLAYKLRQLMN